MSLHFPKNARLVRRADYQRVFAQFWRSKDDYFTVLACLNSGRARLGLAIAKKKIKRAVARNRIKRLIRESFRHHQSELFGLDIVVMASKLCEQADNHRLFDSLAQHWQALNRLRPKQD